MARLVRDKIQRILIDNTTTDAETAVVDALGSIAASLSISATANEPGIRRLLEDQLLLMSAQTGDPHRRGQR